MIEYAPWSRKELDTALESYRRGFLSILDVQLGGSCNFRCLYCDSPDRAVRSTVRVADLASLLDSGHVRWLFVCGLGEPLVRENLSQFLELLDACAERGIRCSAFSNVSRISDDVLRHVDRGLLNLLVKCDSLDEEVARSIYRSEESRDSLRGVADLESHVRIDGGQTNIALSIVPTSLNREEIPDLVRYCRAKGFYPLIGDLENSGMDVETYAKLKLSDEELRDLRERVDDVLGCKYSIPICPSVIGGIHVNHEGKAIVDAHTGLSCHWFWLEAPRVESVFRLNPSLTYEAACAHIIAARNKKIQATEALAESQRELFFGGCGGDIRNLLRRFVSVHKEAHG